MDGEVDNSALRRRLADLYPQELEFFKRVFLWGGSTRGCYTRSFYEEKTIGAWTIPKWRPLRARGRYQNLYGDLVDSLAEKHLAFDNYCHTCDHKDRLRPEIWEDAFWVGTMAGATTGTDALDIDLHDRIGWFCVPTRHHWLNSGDIGPYEYRAIPVVRPNLRFYMVAKVVFDHFPDRIWAFSSGTLGFAVWRLLRRKVNTAGLYETISDTLQQAGIPWLEHYPIPNRSGDGMGRCHRRPCGADSAIITPTGIITDPIRQIQWFMAPGKTPSFRDIVREHLNALKSSYRAFVRCGEADDHSRISKHQKIDLVKECLAEMKRVCVWHNAGCRIDYDLLAEARPIAVQHGQLYTNIINSTGGKREVEIKDEPEEELQSETLQTFTSADLLAIVEQGKWLEYVRFLTVHGLTVDDKFYEILSTLAKWFLFVEFHGLADSSLKTSQVLNQFVLSKHNGHVTRMVQGEEAEVYRHIDRIVKSVETTTDGDNGFFAEVRRKRSQGRYSHVWSFAHSILNNTKEYDPTGSLLEDDEEQDESNVWQYTPDETPLPESVLKVIHDQFEKSRRQIRMRNGEYPVLLAITRFFNYLLAGRIPGTRRCSVSRLVRMGFNTRGKDRDRVIDLLVRANLLYKGGYRSLEQSRIWSLAEPDLYLRHRSTLPNIDRTT